MTDKQKRYVDFISDFIKEHGYPPSIREIAKGVGVTSTSGVKKMLDKLTFSGIIRRKENMARGININVLKKIPLLGRIKAGIPTFSEENIEKFIDLNPYLNNEEIFFLKAEGDSMIEAGIMDGDYLLVKKTQTLNNSEIGIFRINGEVTVKRFYKSDGNIKLLPSNLRYKEIHVREGDEFEIVGKVVALLRNLGGFG
jgi:repressor LexA